MTSPQASTKVLEVKIDGKPVQLQVEREMAELKAAADTCDAI
jgi:hypothetical protein